MGMLLRRKERNLTTKTDVTAEAETTTKKPAAKRTTRKTTTKE